MRGPGLLPSGEPRAFPPAASPFPQGPDVRTGPSGSPGRTWHCPQLRPLTQQSFLKYLTWASQALPWGSRAGRRGPGGGRGDTRWGGRFPSKGLEPQETESGWTKEEAGRGGRILRCHQSVGWALGCGGGWSPTMTLNADASDETREAAGWRSGTGRVSRDTGLGGGAGETKADSAAASTGHQPLAGGPGRRRGADEQRAAVGPTFRPRADWRRRRGAGPEATGGAGPVRRLRSTGPPRAGGWAERAPRAGAGERGEGAERAAKPARARLGAEGGGPRAGTAAASGGGSGGGS